MATSAAPPASDWRSVNSLPLSVSSVRILNGAALALDGDEHPARGPVDGHEEVAPGRLIGHLRRVLHIQVHVPRIVGFEGLGTACCADEAIRACRSRMFLRARPN